MKIINYLDLFPDALAMPAELFALKTFGVKSLGLHQNDIPFCVQRCFVKKGSIEEEYVELKKTVVYHCEYVIAERLFELNNLKYDITYYNICSCDNYSFNNLEKIIRCRKNKAFL